jgi:hypothetical protein
MRRPSPGFTLVATMLLAAGCSGNDSPIDSSPLDALADSGIDGSPARDTRSDLARKDSSAQAQGGWAISAGSTKTDGIWEIVPDGSGNLVVSGFFNGKVSFGSTILSTTSDLGSIFVGKVDKDGKFLWAVALDGSPTVWAGMPDGLAVDSSGNIYFGGEFKDSATFGSTTLTSKGDYDIFIVKLDSNGKVLWATSAGGTGADYVDRLAVGSDDKLTLAGSFAGTVSFGETELTAAGVVDLLLARLDSDGNFEWAVQAGGASTEIGDFAVDMMLDSWGNIYITGGVGPSATFGSLSFAGKTGSLSAFVAKLDSTGQFTWVASPSLAAFGVSIARGASGELYVASLTHIANSGNGLVGTFGYAFVSELSSTGSQEWSTMLAGSQIVHVNRLLVDQNGKTTIAGYFNGSALLGSTVLTSKGYGINPFVARLDSSGKVTQAVPIEVDNWGSAVGMARDKSGNTYVSGEFNGTAVFGGTTLKTKGLSTASDAFLWNMGTDKE